MNRRYQKCREVAFLQPAPATGSLRSKHLTLESLIEQCKYAFGGLDPSDAAADVGPTPFNKKFGGSTMTPEVRFYIQLKILQQKMMILQHKMMILQ